jgi:hypothetical protein
MKNTLLNRIAVLLLNTFLVATSGLTAQYKMPTIEDVS